jgi:RHS repeat-associated protein
MDHDPFGNGDPSDPLGNFTDNLRFPGQFFDQATRLHYNYFRDYDPRTGRYIESDPVGLAGGSTHTRTPGGILPGSSTLQV